jgi:RNA-binding protein YhbY
LTNYYGPGGSIFPNLDAFNVKFKPLQRLLNEIQRLYDQERQTGIASTVLREKIDNLERQYAQDRVAAIRAGEEELSDEHITEARANLDKLNQRARELVKADIFRCVQENGEEWAQQLEQPLAEKVAVLEEKAQEMRAITAEVAAYARLKEWLGAPERGFGITPIPGSDSLDTVVEQAQRRAQGHAYV